MRERFAEPIAELKELLGQIDAGLNRPEVKPTHTDLEDAVMGHWARATAATMGVLRLSETAYGDLAMTLNRTLGELLSSAAWLLVVPEERDARAQRFWEFALIEAASEARLAEQVGWTRTAEAIRSQLDAEHVATLRKQFGNPALGWTQLRAVNLQREIKPYWAPSRWPTIEALLTIARGWGNPSSHAGAALTLQRVAVIGSDRTIRVRGDTERVPQALRLARNLLKEITGVCSEALGITELQDTWPIRPAPTG